MSAVTTEKSKTAGAVVDEPVVPVQAGPVDEQAATAEAIAGALDPALVSRLAAQARAQGGAAAGPRWGVATADEAVPGGRLGGRDGRASRLRQVRSGGA